MSAASPDAVQLLPPGRAASHEFKGADRADVIDRSRIWSPADGPRKIEVSITVQSIEKINTIEESADIGLLIDAYWLPSAEELAVNGRDGSSWDHLGNFQTVNAIRREAECRKDPAMKDVGGGLMKWHTMIWISASYKQRFLLHSFPLDCQTMVVRFEMGNVKKMVYTPVAHQSIVMSVETALCPLTDWEWAGASVVMAGTDPSLSKQGNSYSQMVLEFHMARQWKPYFYRVFLFTFILLWSTAFSYSIDALEEGGVADRLGFIFTLLLTNVAFQFTIHTTLPDAPYTTLLERYIFLGFVMNFCCAVETVLLKGSFSKLKVAVETLQSVDDWAMVVHLLLLAAIHIAGLIYCCVERRRQRKMLQESTLGTPAANIRVAADNVGSGEAGDPREHIFTWHAKGRSRTGSTQM
eukprot:g5827.t1